MQTSLHVRAVHPDGSPPTWLAVGLNTLVFSPTKARDTVPSNGRASRPTRKGRNESHRLPALRVTRRSSTPGCRTAVGAGQRCSDTCACGVREQVRLGESDGSPRLHTYERQWLPRKPKRPILGSDVSGTIEAVGTDVTQFHVGDEVLGDILWHGLGGFARYVSAPERAPLILKPKSMTSEQAATIPQAALLALQGLRHEGQVEPGDKVLINGAGGGGGTFANQPARSWGAEVTGVDSTTKLDAMRTIGAEHVIGYTGEDYAKSGQTYDRILDFAAHRSLFAYKKALRPNGTYAMVGGSTLRLVQAGVFGSFISKRGTATMGLLIAKPNKEDLSHVVTLVEPGELTPVIDRHYQLSEVPEALRRLGDELAIGKIVITV